MLCVCVCVCVCVCFHQREIERGRREREREGWKQRIFVCKLEQAGNPSPQRPEPASPVLESDSSSRIQFDSLSGTLSK